MDGSASKWAFPYGEMSMPIKSLLFPQGNRYLYTSQGQKTHYPECPFCKFNTFQKFQKFQKFRKFQKFNKFNKFILKKITIFRISRNFKNY